MMNQVRPIIGFDVDDVLAALIPEWLRRYNMLWGDSLTPEDLASWAISEYVKPECGLKVLDLLGAPDFYDSVAPIPGALEAVNQAREIGRVVFITSCGEDTIEQKFRWLKHHGFTQDMAEYYPARDKSLINADFLVDDAIHNVDAFPRRSLLVTRPHNRAFTPKTAVRIHDLSEVAPRIKIFLGT